VVEEGVAGFVVTGKVVDGVVVAAGEPQPAMVKTRANKIIRRTHNFFTGTSFAMFIDGRFFC